MDTTNRFGLEIYRYPDEGIEDTEPYQLQVKIAGRVFPESEFHDFATAQDAFDFCAKQYPGEKVAVDIIAPKQT